MEAIRVNEEWQKAGVYYVRTEAMVLGFDLSLESEFADDKPHDKYILVLDDEKKPLSTNRVHVVDELNIVKFERVATIASARGRGAGRLGIEEAEKWAYELGYRHIVITSRKEAEGFYKKLGYITRDDMNPDTLKPRSKNDPIREIADPRFICVYMEKFLF